MRRRRPRAKESAGQAPAKGLSKAPTGILGVDEITGGGLPRGRPTLVCGGPGCGKTLFATEFLVRGALEYGEPGVFMLFEETAEELAENTRSLGFDLDQMVARGQLAIDHVRVEPSEIEETGEYNLDGLFIRLAYAIDSIKAKRVVLDTIETLFSGFSNQAILRAELRRLFSWLKDRGVTTVITGERGQGQLTRQGLEEYVSDAVILLDHRVSEQRSIRRLRIVKYRGSAHGTNEYPFLIDEQGFSVLPITSLGLDSQASNEVVSFGVQALDEMLGVKGMYRGTSALVSGAAGTGKTSLASSFVDASCRRGERCLFLAYEESPQQLVRNMRSIGIDLQRWIDKGLLQIQAARPSSHGLEMHLVSLHKAITTFQPRALVMDPISSLAGAGTLEEAQAMLIRTIDFLKQKGVTALYTSLTTGDRAIATSEVGISSLIDTWILLRQTELNGERNRTLFVLKSRGMSHSNQVREFILNEHGIGLRDAYLGPEGVLTGSARLAQEARDRERELRQREELAREQSRLSTRHKALEAQREALDVELQNAADELGRLTGDEQRRRERHAGDQKQMARSRQVDLPRNGRSNSHG
ncbi:MAG TPA: circadian clock protein KaiC [Polyangia bacterium]